MTHSLPARAVAALYGRAAPSLVHLELPIPSAHQIRYTVVSTGLCRSQLNQIADASQRTGEGGRLLGHEAVGVVESVGEHVTTFEVGDSVLISWLPRIAHPSSHRPEPIRLVSADHGLLETPDVFTWATAGLCDETFAYPAPTTQAELAVLGCAVMTGAGAVMNTLAVQPGESVVIVGAGGIGLTAIAAAKALGASIVIAMDVDDSKLALARCLGATHVVNSLQEDPVTAVMALTGNSGADAVADCVGFASTLSTSLNLLSKGTAGHSRGGRLAIVGVPSEPVLVDVRSLQVSEQLLAGSFGGSTVVERDFPKYLEWVLDGRLNLHDLVTDRMNFDELIDGAERLAAGKVKGRAVVII